MYDIPLKSNLHFCPNELDIIVWETAYPHINIEETLAKIAAWNHSAPPSQRKTLTGIRKHINAWMSRENDKQLARSLRGTLQHQYSRDWIRAACGR